MSHNALSVANVILDEATLQGVDVTPMQLQKLLYFTNGWYIEIHNGQPMLSDNFKAWKFGPVMPKVYHEFKQYGSKQITGRALSPFDEKPWPNTLSDEQKTLTSEIIRIYGKLSGPRMSNLTHQTGTPWYKTWNGGVGDGDDILPNLILEEFRKLRVNANDRS